MCPLTCRAPLISAMLSSQVRPTVWPPCSCIQASPPSSANLHLLQPQSTILSVLLDEALFAKQVSTCISGLVAEYIVAIDVTRARFPADALFAP